MEQCSPVLNATGIPVGVAGELDRLVSGSISLKFEDVVDPSEVVIYANVPMVSRSCLLEA